MPLKSTRLRESGSGTEEIDWYASPEGRRQTQREFEKALKDGFTQKEVDDARDGWLQSRVVQRAEDRSLASLLATRDDDGRTFGWDEQLEARVKALTQAEITAAMRRNLDVSQISIVKAGDFKKAAGK